MSATAVRNAAEYESRLQQYYFERAEEGARRSRRREGGLRAGSNRRSLPRPVHATADRSTAGGRDGRERRRPRAPVPAAQDVRGRRHLGGDRRAGGRARERDPRRPGDVPRRGDAVALCAGAARRSRFVRRPRGARRARADRVGRIQPGPAHAPGGARAARGRCQRRGRPRCAQRGGEGDLLARARGCARCCFGRDDGCVGPTSRHLVREAARPRTRRAALECARALSPPAITARVDVHERRCGRHLPGDDARARLRHDRDPEHPPRSRGPAAEESRARASSRRIRPRSCI